MPKRSALAEDAPLKARTASDVALATLSAASVPEELTHAYALRYAPCTVSWKDDGEASSLEDADQYGRPRMSSTMTAVGLRHHYPTEPVVGANQSVPRMRGLHLLFASLHVL